ncbi:hypothetical protein SAMN02745157_3507 [Kaistia soli DSM 19436]|uniref:Uncharacterized protein n=1 Tax=Kaistia soli DSM 19436 TaxID=1122133 RepID=A0A1M5GSJ5_9HYPH|nr:hypothetical protein [Kaistia soli]SHG06631.1 hypothetical protein SAMN02745157_3507 [Kaistia soli DSM 19436]
MRKNLLGPAMRAAATLALFAGLLAPMVNTARADSVSNTVQALDASVQDLRIAGNWEKDGRKGVYRILVARTAAPKPTARLFVQWIATGVDGSLRVERSIEIAELAELKLDISDFVAESDPDGLSVFVEVVDPSQDTDQSYELFVDDDGTYRFGPASN